MTESGHMKEGEEWREGKQEERVQAGTHNTRKSGSMCERHQDDEQTQETKCE